MEASFSKDKLDNFFTTPVDQFYENAKRKKSLALFKYYENIFASQDFEDTTSTRCNSREGSTLHNYQHSRNLKITDVVDHNLKKNIICEREKILKMYYNHLINQINLTPNLKPKFVNDLKKAKIICKFKRFSKNKNCTTIGAI